MGAGVVTGELLHAVDVVAGQRSTILTLRALLHLTTVTAWKNMRLLARLVAITGVDA